MSIVESIARRAGQLAEDVQVSLKRARLEGEKRLLQRAHRTALEELGTRVMELAPAGEIRSVDLAAEMAAVAGRAEELAAKVAEIDELKEAVSGDEGSPNGEGAPAQIGPGSPAPAAGPGWAAADRFFSKGDDR